MSEYVNFDLLISPAEGEHYDVRVTDSPVGPATGGFVPPLSDLEFENFLLRIGRPRRSTGRGAGVSQERAAAEDVGVIRPSPRLPAG